MVTPSYGIHTFRYSRFPLYSRNSVWCFTFFGFHSAKKPIYIAKNTGRAGSAIVSFFWNSVINKNTPAMLLRAIAFSFERIAMRSQKMKEEKWAFKGRVGLGL